MKKYVIEMIGTFFLVLTIAFSGNPLAIGAILMTMVYMGGYISGAHYNPAVTLAVLIRGKINLADAGCYVLAQMIGATLAASVFWIIGDSAFVPAPAATASFFEVVLLEALFTFALASVVLHVATAEETKGNDYYGVAIGSTVMVGAFAVGPITGGVFNPAVALGPMIINAVHIQGMDLLAYLCGPLLGAAFAGVLYRLIKNNRRSTER